MNPAAKGIPPRGPYTVQDLMAIVQLLRDAANGCPWDKVQTHASIRMNFLEEAYEAVDAIDLNDPELLCEELGDVLMQVVFHTCIEQEQGHFTWQEVCDGVCRKLVERHPHIFADAPGINDWDTIKNIEKGRVTLQDDLQSVPMALPALMRAAKLQKRAARGGAATEVDLPQLQANLQRAVAAQSTDEAEQAVGKLLFATVALANKLGVNPEQALQRENKNFQQRVPQQTSQKDGT